MVHDITLHMFTMQLSSNTVLAPTAQSILVITTHSPRTSKENNGEEGICQAGTKYRQRKDGRGVHERGQRDQRPESKGGIVRHAPEPRSGRRTARNERRGKSGGTVIVMVVKHLLLAFTWAGGHQRP